MAERSVRSSSGLGCLTVIILIGFSIFGYRYLFGEIPYVNRVSQLVADYTWRTQAISFYDLAISLPPDWTIDEHDRWIDKTSSDGQQIERECANYVISNPDKTVALYLQSPCGFDGSVRIEACIPGIEVVGEKIGRYLSMIKNRYIYTRTGYCTQDDRDYLGQKSLGLCCQDVFFMGHTTILIEAQFMGKEADRDRVLDIVDRIVLSIR